MSLSILEFHRNNQLPSREEIETQCLKHGLYGRGIAIRESSGGDIIAWAKYGVDVTTPEALTQEWVARELTADPTTLVRVPHVFDAWTVSKPYFNLGFIVMEHIDLPDCDNGDSKLVAAAVQRLHRVEAPGPAPGPFGGGPTVHHFFEDWDSRIIYKTVKELEDHINGILRIFGDKNRVTFDTKLLLCPSDITPGNFKKGDNGVVVALDFRASCFLPSAFFSYALQMPVNDFDRIVSKHIKHQPSSNVRAMAVASSRLVICGKNDIALPRSITRRNKC